MLKLQNICVDYQQKSALSQVSMDFPTAKTTVLLGSSGSGKSTILKVILGLKTLSSGQITGFTAGANGQQIGYMPQGSGLFPHLSLAANVTLMPKHLGWPESQIQDKLKFLCKLVQLDIHTISRFPQQVSGGQKQRAALMRALILDPPLLLLDEPLGALDPITRYDLQGDLRDIFKKLQKTVILVTHDLREAEYFADQIYLMHNGQVIQEGSFADLTSKPADSYVSRFVKAQRDFGRDDNREYARNR